MPNVWPAVSDVFIGFLALLLIAGLTAYTAAIGNGKEPPPAKKEFRSEFEKAFIQARSGAGVRASDKAQVRDQGFSELNIYFPAAFLFQPCQTELMTPAATELNDLKSLFNRFDDQILRVQITGHTDTDRPGVNCFNQGIRTNWELSARRAITVLELLAPDNGTGLDPRKAWAAALGEYHPVSSGNSSADKKKDRRIEVLVRFKEGDNS